MAEADQMTTNIEVEGGEKNLKYLEFVQIAALHSVFCLAKIYGYAKDNSGPMKPSVQTVEGTVKKVVGPVYEKFHDVPNDFLKFVDRKVDESVTTVENHVSPRLKQASTQAFSAAQKAPAAALSVASDVKNAGVIGTASGLAKTVYVKYEPTAKELYSKYEPVAEKYAVSTWRSLNKLPLFPQVAQTVVPAAAYVSERYNLTVQQTAEKGFKVASYLPLVPTEKIAMVFNDATVNPSVSANPGGIATGEPVAAS